jgi:hypothetical protein
VNKLACVRWDCALGSETGQPHRPHAPSPCSEPGAGARCSSSAFYLPFHLYSIYISNSERWPLAATCCQPRRPLHPSCPPTIAATCAAFLSCLVRPPLPPRPRLLSPPLAASASLTHSPRSFAHAPRCLPLFRLRLASHLRIATPLMPSRLAMLLSPSKHLRVPRKGQVR